MTVAAAQASLDRICIKFDARLRRGTECGRRSVSLPMLNGCERCRRRSRPCSTSNASSATLPRSRSAATDTPCYPGHSGEIVSVRHTPLGSMTLDIVDRHGAVLAHHVRQPDGAGAVVRLDEHVKALTKVALGNLSDAEPCRRRNRRPPNEAALAEAERLRRQQSGLGDGDHVVVDFADYVEQTRPFGSSSGGDEHAGNP